MAESFFDKNAGLVAFERNLLGELETQWRRHGAPIVDLLRPGISPDEVDGLAAPHGLVVPPELKVLWNWHDGAVLPAHSPQTVRSVGPAYEFLSAAECFEQYEFNRSVHAHSPAPDEMPEMYWHKSWLPFMTADAQRLYVDCDRPLTLSWWSPVRLVSWEWEAFDVDRAISVSHMVSAWVWLLAQDYYRWDIDADPVPRWKTDNDFPLWMWQSGLA